GHAAAEAIVAHTVSSNAAGVVAISAFNGWLRKRDLTADAVRLPDGASGAGRMLGADLVISGSGQASGPDLEISAWVADARTGAIKKRTDVTGHVEHMITLLDQLTAELFKSEGWPAPKAGAIGTTNVYAFRDAMIGLELLSLQTFGPLQKSILPAGALKKA